MFKDKKGFTLIEIVVVMAIVGLLSSVFIVGLGTVRVRGRDTKRVADLRQVQNALELFYSRCGYYPSDTSATAGCGGLIAGTDASLTWTQLTTRITDSTLGLGISKMPLDPLNNATYFYKYGVKDGGQSYVIGAQLESGNDPALNDDVDPATYTVTCTDPVYCIQL